TPAPLAEARPAPANPREVAEALASDLATRKFDQAWARLDDEFQKGFSAQKLGDQFDPMSADLGAFKQVIVTREEEGPGGAKKIFVTCEYERAGLPLMVVVDQSLRVSGLRPVTPKREQLQQAAREFVELMAASQWAKLVERFDGTMRKALTEEKLAAIVGQLKSERGEFRQILSMRSKRGYVDVDHAFEKSNAVIRVAFDQQLRVNGLHFREGWNTPGYVTPKSFTEKEVQIGTEKLPLPATLTVPSGKGPFPAVVLVHGSGPNDRDESSGPNKIFKDLAWGLASRGVAVLRFEKRTEQYRGKLQDEDIPTAKEESIDDTVTAVDLLLKTANIDPRRIIVAGHSLGAELAPRIAQADPRVHAIVLLAGPTRSEGQIKLDQTRYLVGPWGVSKEEAEKLIREAEQIAARLDSPDLKPDEVVDGIAGQYWLDLRDHAGKLVAPQLKIPILVLQGERDYLVTMVDFEGWKKALQGKPNATFKSYPGLNHHFMFGKGPSVPKEYEELNHVPEQVVEDIAAWVRSH
ncbi:MAG: alpha/beta fold hydrolase, partial [Deltaproteobacteria bacterium]|nr:alpha/beta fold hydrolase [Deltaproteobacteria bacterium]